MNFHKKILRMINKNEPITLDETLQKFNKEVSILCLASLQVKRMYDKVIPHV